MIAATDSTVADVSSRNSPPRAPLAFRVGVVGHRPNRLENADFDLLGGVIHAVLAAVKNEVEAVKKDCHAYYDSSTSVVRAITPLAEGTDRIFAEQALALGYEVSCVMPFAKEEFEHDFAPGQALEENSLIRFRGILDRAQRESRLTTFELDGCRSDEGTAYGAAGRVVLNQSDLLVVVWDGYRHDRRGGTEETFDEARRLGVPTVWIDACRPHAWQLIDDATPLRAAAKDLRATPNESGTVHDVRTWVRESLDVPQEMTKDKRTENPRLNLEQFYAEYRPAWTIAVVWKVFRDLLGDSKLKRTSLSVSPFEEDVKADWPADRSTPIGGLVDSLRPYYAWPDKLAVLYSDRYRSAFIFAFVLAAAAVGLALTPIAFNLETHHRIEALCIGAELTAILIILILVLKGRYGRWHERWIDYRLAAELVRHLRLVAPLGGGRPFPMVPAHWATYGQPGASWMAWYVRAIERKLGLPTAVADRAYLEQYLNHLGDLLGGAHGQIEYHGTNAHRSHRIESRLHLFCAFLLCVTLVACALHLLPSIWPAINLPTWIRPHVLTFLCGFCPALGAAMQGIVNQGEFRRIAKHSEAMQLHLGNLLKKIDELRDELATAPASLKTQYSTRASALASDAARLLVNEVLDWRVVFLDQPLRPPA